MTPIEISAEYKKGCSYAENSQAALWLKDADLWEMWHASQAEHPRSNNAIRSFARKIIVATVEQNIREARPAIPKIEG